MQCPRRVASPFRGGLRLPPSRKELQRTGRLPRRKSILSFRDAPPTSGLPDFGNIIVQVGNSRLGCAGAEFILAVVVMDSGLIAEPVIGRRRAPTRWRCPGMTSGSSPRAYHGLYFEKGADYYFS